MVAKDFYSSYIADSNLAPLNHKLLEVIKGYNPGSVFEFGSGTGKHLNELRNINPCGMDVSFYNTVKAFGKYDLKFLIYGDETRLRHLCNFDVVFTCSVLDHIENIDQIMIEFKRMTNKAIILAETQLYQPENYYFYHKYEDYGFLSTGYEWKSEKPDGDGNVYRIWVSNV